MNAKYYAQIDDDGVVCGVSQLKDSTKEKNMIGIDYLDFSIVGAKYENGRFDKKSEIVEEKYEDNVNKNSMINQIDELKEIINELKSYVITDKK